MAYRWTPRNTVETLEDLRDYLETELAAIEAADQETTELELRESFRFPTKPREGMIIHANAPLNPGYGNGPYSYINGLWVPLAGLGILVGTTAHTYASTAGSDSNDGLTLATPKRHIQNAVDLGAGYFVGPGAQVIVHVADGNYAERVQLRAFSGSGTMVLEGNLVTPGNVLIDTSGGTDASVNTGAPITLTSSPGRWTIRGFKLKANRLGNFNNINVSQHSNLTYSNIDFDDARIHISCTYHSIVFSGGSNRIVAANFNIYHYIDTMGIIQEAAKTITIVGAPNCLQAWAWVIQGGQLVSNLNTYSPGVGSVISGGSAYRYYVDPYATIFTGGAGPNYFPGTTAVIHDYPGGYT